MTIGGEPTAKVVQIELSGACGMRRATIPLHRILATELLDPIPHGAPLTPAAYFEGENLAHRSGKLVADAELSGGGAWAAIKGQTEARLHHLRPLLPAAQGQVRSSLPPPPYG